MATGQNNMPVFFIGSPPNVRPRHENFVVNPMTRAMPSRPDVPEYYGQYFRFYANQYDNLNNAPSPGGSRDTLNRCMYYCDLCNLLSFKKSDFVHHVLSPSHLSGFREDNFSFFCGICNATIYGPLRNIMVHTATHGQPLARLPELCILQSKILKRYKSNATDKGMFACVRCRKFGPMDPTNNNYQNHCTNCHMIAQHFCPICNVTFSCPSFTYEMHTHSFEHIYIGWRRFDLH